MFFFSVCVCFVLVNICIAYCPLTGNVESSVPLMLADDDDDDDGDDNHRITTATTRYARQCMHCFLLAV